MQYSKRPRIQHAIKMQRREARMSSRLIYLLDIIIVLCAAALVYIVFYAVAVIMTPEPETTIKNYLTNQCELVSNKLNVNDKYYACEE